MHERGILDKAIGVLKESLDSPEVLAFKIEPAPALVRGRAPDAIFRIEIGKGRKKLEDLRKESVESKLAGKNFVVEVRMSVQPRFLRSGISYLKEIKEEFPDWNPLIVTPYIGPGARALCRREGVSYIDTLGNVGIFLKSVFILKESKESLKTERRELKSLFSPKSTRVIRILLENASRIWLFKELASTTQVSLGQTYNVIRKLIDEEYLKRTEKGIKLAKPSELLERWSTVYKVAQTNKMESFYLSENVYRRLIKRIADIAEKENYSYAFTLFAGANLITPWVRTPHMHLYLLGNIKEFAEKTNLKPVTSGGNVHLILPYDEGVFNPIQMIEGVKIVGNIQLYLDLVNYPARGKEQAEVLREKVIRF